MLIRRFVISMFTAMLLVPAMTTVITADESGTQTDDSKAKQSAEPDPRIGKKVIVTVAGAALRTPDAVVWKAYLGETFTVSLTNDQWLWIENRGGWLWEKETIPFDGAIARMTEQIAKEANAKNYHLRGIAHAAHGNYDKAIADYSESLKKEPGDAGVLNNRGQAHYLKQNYDSAVRDFDAAISADPKHFVAMNNRALCRIATADYANAVNDLNVAIELNKEYPEALNNRGVVHSRQGHYKPAIADFSAAIKIDDNYTDAYGNRSYAYRKLGSLQEAIADLKTAMEISPLDYKPVNDLAWIYATTSSTDFRNGDEAVKLATRACEMTQYKDWNPLDTLAAACAAAGDFEAAQQWISTALEHTPADSRQSVEAHQKLILTGKPVTE